MRQDAEEGAEEGEGGEGRQVDGIEDSIQQWVVVGERGFDEIEDKLWTGGEEGDGRLTIWQKIKIKRIIFWVTCQAAVGRQEWGREAIVGKSINQPSFPPTCKLTLRDIMMSIAAMVRS